MTPATNAAGERITGPAGPTATTPQEWLDVRDMGRRYKADPRSIYRWSDLGAMPPGKKFGALRRWSRREIEAWEAAGCPTIRTARGAAR